MPTSRDMAIFVLMTTTTTMTQPITLPLVHARGVTIVHARDELDSAVQLPNFRLVAAWHAACIMHRRCAIYSFIINYISQENT